MAPHITLRPRARELLPPPGPELGKTRGLRREWLAVRTSGNAPKTEIPQSEPFTGASAAPLESAPRLFRRIRHDRLAQQGRAHAAANHRGFLAAFSGPPMSRMIRAVREDDIWRVLAGISFIRTTTSSHPVPPQRQDQAVQMSEGEWVGRGVFQRSVMMMRKGSEIADGRRARIANRPSPSAFPREGKTSSTLALPRLR